MKTATGRTWFIDVDGTIFEHRSNQELDNGVDDVLLPGAKELLDKIPKSDTVIITTARMPHHRVITIESFRRFNLRCDSFIFGLGSGARILINDEKEMKNSEGIRCKKAHALSVKRNKGISHMERNRLLWGCDYGRW